VRDQSRGKQAGVLHLIDTGGPGGAEMLFSQLIQRLGQPQLRPVAVIPGEGWLSIRLRKCGIQPHVLSPKGSFKVSYLRALVRLIRRERIRLIHTHLLGSAVYGALAGLITRTPVIAVIHGPTDLQCPGNLVSLKRLIVARSCSAIVAVSSGTREALEAFGVEAARITLITNGVDTDAFTRTADTPLRERLGLRESNLLVGAVGNIRAPKAYDVFLKAAAIIHKQMPNVHFAVAGQGDEPSMLLLVELRHSLGLDANFHFLGLVESNASLYSSFDVFVSSSNSEGLSLAFLEAMSSERAIVATSSSGALEAIETEASGLLVPVGNHRALADMIVRLLIEQEARSAFGVAARERAVARFSLEATVSGYETLYRHLVQF
jgi:glycosyltransferase involved in cell wall biosynthesis